MALRERGELQTGSLGVKAPCVAATLGNITLYGLQTVDGYEVQENDRVLVRAQTNLTENGVWVAKQTHWVRAPDFDGVRDAVGGTLVPVAQGVTLAGNLFGVTGVGPVQIGVDEIEFEARYLTTAEAAAIRNQTIAARNEAQSAQSGAESAKTGAELAQAAAEAAASVVVEPLSGTSSTSNSIGFGTKNFTTQAGRAWEIGSFVLAVHPAAPSNYMIGQVVSYDGTALSLSVPTGGFAGSGTYSDWLLTLSGARGTQGPPGPAGTGSGDMIGANNLNDVDDPNVARANIGAAALNGSATEAFAASNVTVTGTTDTKSYKEGVFAITDGATVNLDPNNGTIQTWTLGDNRTPGQVNWATGQSITLLVDDGSARTITWSTLGVVWKTNGGTAPTLQTTGFTVIVLWKVGTTIYGARVGDA